MVTSQVTSWAGGANFSTYFYSYLSGTRFSLAKHVNVETGYYETYKRIFIVPINYVKHVDRSTISQSSRPREKKIARVRRVDFDFWATIPTTRIIYKSDCEQPSNGVIRRKRKSLSLIPHDWSLKCIFFKWNIKKKNLLYYIFSLTHTHASLHIAFIFFIFLNFT